MAGKSLQNTSARGRRKHTMRSWVKLSVTTVAHQYMTIIDIQRTRHSLPIALKTLFKSDCKVGYFRTPVDFKYYVQYELLSPRQHFPKQEIETSTYIKPFPDHCEKNAKAIMILIRFLFPGVLNKVNQPISLAASLSSASAALISSTSNSTSGSCSFPPAW